MDTTEPLVHGSSHGWARIAAAGLLGALGVASLFISPDRGLDNPTYSSQISLARIGWLATCSLAAVIIRPDWRGLLAAWLGALIALMPVIPLYLSQSPTPDGSASLIGASYLLMASYAEGRSSWPAAQPGSSWPSSRPNGPAGCCWACWAA